MTRRNDANGNSAGKQSSFCRNARAAVSTHGAIRLNPDDGITRNLTFVRLTIVAMTMG
jgi:hypothetical protein